jgi:hypothetical protein
VIIKKKTLATLIKLINNKIRVEFDTGKFDDWCVYLSKPALPRYAPTDIEYFSLLKHHSKTHGTAKIYNDFISYYELTGKEINPAVLEKITSVSIEYGPDAEEMDTWFTVIYAGMIAEENKVNAILKKRIKRLGMHQLLLENFTAEEAANFSKNKKWQELDILMKQKGF